MNWFDVTREKLRAYSTNMAALIAQLRSENVSDEAIEGFIHPYVESIERLYLIEHPAAQAAEADLIVSYTGRINENGRPPLSVIKKMVDKLSSCAKEMTVGEIGDAGNARKLPRDFELILTGYTPHPSLMLALPKAEEIDQMNFEFQNEFLSATKKGIDHLATVAEAVASAESDPDQLKARLGSPAIFDLGLSVLPKLLPRDAQVSGVVLSGKALRRHDPITVNHASVKKGNSWLTPFESEDEDSFIGFVDRPTATHLRFNLMHVEGHPNRIIRCRFQKNQQEQVRDVWGKRARVIGKVQYNRQKKPSLVEVTKLEVAQSSTV